jgi:hypothetical protein
MIQERLTLPSLGVPYGTLDCTTVTLTPLTTKAYKDFMVSTGEDAVLSLLDSCLVDSPQRAEHYVHQDVLAMYLHVRAMSLGHLLPVQAACTHCEHKGTYEWDISTAPVRYLTTTEYPVTVQLPSTGEQVQIRLGTAATQRAALAAAQRRAERYKQKVSSLLPQLYTCSLFTLQRPMELVERWEWYTALTLQDVLYIDAAVAAVGDFGVTMVQQHSCPECAQEVAVPLVVDAAFFRPSLGHTPLITTASGTLAGGLADTAAAPAAPVL